MNQLQENILTYDFQIQYKKGATLPADFLSRDVVKGLNDIVNSIDLFGPDLQELHKLNEQLVKINAFQKEGKWPLNTTKAEIKLLLPLTNSLFLDSKAVWIRLKDEHYPRTALWLPKIYQICEVHGTMLSGHDALKSNISKLSHPLSNLGSAKEEIIKAGPKNGARATTATRETTTQTETVAMAPPPSINSCRC
jgi:hypothetical protein